MKYEKALSLTVHIFNMTKGKFLKVGQTSRSKSLGQKLWNDVKGLLTRNTHHKYER